MNLGTVGGRRRKSTAAIRGLLQGRCKMCRAGEIRHVETTAKNVTQYFHRSAPCEFQGELTQQEINRRRILIFRADRVFR